MSRGKEDRQGTARVGLRRHPFSVNREIFTLRLLQLEMNLKISRNAYRHSHSKYSHGPETQIYIFVVGFFKCFITNYITRFFTYLFIGLKNVPYV